MSLLPGGPQAHSFAEPWQAQVHALTLSLVERGLFSWDEWRAALAAEGRRAPHSEPYQQWLSALEQLAAAKGATSRSELDRYQKGWDRAAHRTPHGAPIILSEGDLHG